MIKLDEIYSKIHRLGVEHLKLSWTLYTTGYDFGIQKQYEQLVDALKDEKAFEIVKEYYEQELSPVEARKAELVFNTFKPYHQSKELNELNMAIQTKTNELSKVLNTFRFQFGGKEVSSVELNQVLNSEDDRKLREEAYLAKNQINKALVDAGFIELINLRKEYARQYGSKDFISFKLEENELDSSIFENWLPQLHEILPAMKETRGRYANEFLHDDRMFPWDEGYIDARIAPALNESVDMSDYYENIDELFQLFDIDIAKFNITYDIFPRANKSEWGYNFPIENARDSRILANVKNKYHEYGVLLHETGHAVHSFLLNPEEEILNKGVSGIISEGIANLFQGFLYSPVFYKKFFKDEAS
ncbi:peptidase M3A and M3B thimet/oligopeptidase F [Peribacillus sp. SCS-155]|uniref:peptidase M3A and M3B thimet/oligopeptidase F n=1 Tax=Peribacillus sedimenti TaxID=3115297 RepID=UPI003905FD07